MSTNSRIGIQNDDGTVSSIYCHWDGYLEHNGTILFGYYKDRQKIQDLINLGDISVLGQLVEYDPNEDIQNDKSSQSVTISYHRDRGEKYKPPTVDDSLESFENKLWEPFGYVYTLNDEWVVFGSKD